MYVPIYFSLPVFVYRSFRLYVFMYGSLFSLPLFMYVCLFCLPVFMYVILVYLCLCMTFFLYFTCAYTDGSKMHDDRIILFLIETGKLRCILYCS